MVYISLLNLCCFVDLIFNPIYNRLGSFFAYSFFHFLILNNDSHFVLALVMHKSSRFKKNIVNSQKKHDRLEWRKFVSTEQYENQCEK